MDKNVANNKPVVSSERIKALDLLRGVAVLGILIMNIQSFSMPGTAYINPMSYGDMTGANEWVWILSHVFGDQKFMTLFSVLFGAGIILITNKAESKSASAKGIHYRRNFFLLIFGIIHGHLIWSGDILFIYALCAFWVYWFRNKSAKTLFIVGLVVISVHSILYLFAGFSMEHWPQEAIEGNKTAWESSVAYNQKEIAAFTGTWGEQIAKTSEQAIFFETFLFLTIFIWRAGGLMLVGIALYKWGVITGAKSIAFYKKTWLINWVIGLPIVIYGVWQNFEHAWAFEFSMFIGSQFNYWGSLFVSMGILSAVMIWAKSGGFDWLKSRLEAVGQMALTNYLMQSILCTFIFYGMGLGLFGSIERTDQIGIVLAVWMIQILWSKTWLEKYRFGPFEWLWRSMTYGKRQPFVNHTKAE